MKKLMIVILVAVSTLVVAQTIDSKPLKYGLKGGVNFARLNGEIEIGSVVVKPKFYTGYTFGAFANYPLSEKFSIQPELLFSRNGSRYEDIKLETFEDAIGGIELGNFANLLGTKLEMYVGTNWLQIPVLGVYQVDESLKLYAGPYIGFYLSGKAFVEASALIFELIDSEYDIKSEDLQLPDFGMIVGGSYDLTKNIAVEARYSYGFIDVADEIIFGFLDDDVIVAKNSAIQLLLQVTL